MYLVDGVGQHQHVILPFQSLVVICKYNIATISWHKTCIIVAARMQKLLVYLVGGVAVVPVFDIIPVIGG